jgi:SAM-dependent methyltransferase
MPEEAYWETLFDVPLILDRLEVDARLRNVVEFGCGYGTFTVPVARLISGMLTTFDIDEAMIERTRERGAAAGAHNVVYVVRDVFVDGFGGEAGSKDACLLFNILHCEEPVRLLAEAARVVGPGGRGAGDSLALRSGDATRPEPGDPAKASADCRVGKGNRVAGGRGAGD